MNLIFRVILLLAVCLLCIQFFDQALSTWFMQAPQVPLRKAAREITDIGKGEYWFGLAIFVYLWLRLVKIKWLKKTLSATEEVWLKWSGRLFISLLVSGILVQLLKLLFGRQRPHLSAGVDAYVFDPMTTNWHFHSFPSGHTQVLFTVATSIALTWPKLTVLSYSIFFALSFTRVMTMQHFLSDVIAGILVGYLGTLWVWSRCDNKRKFA